jgi:hypothetical protein
VTSARSAQVREATHRACALGRAAADGDGPRPRGRRAPRHMALRLRARRTARGGHWRRCRSAGYAARARRVRLETGDLGPMRSSILRIGAPYRCARGKRADRGGTGGDRAWVCYRLCCNMIIL